MDIEITEGRVGPFPAGEYYVGDTCYAVREDERWMKWLEDADYTNTGLRFLLAKLSVIPEAEDEEPEEKYAVGVHTAHGDGVYHGSDGFAYGVDAGMIGVVPVECAQNNALYAMNRKTFAKPFYCSWSDNEGTITIDDIVIPTDPDGEGWYS